MPFGVGVTGGEALGSGCADLAVVGVRSSPATGVSSLRRLVTVLRM